MSQARLTQPGSFCWNEECSAYGKREAGTMRRYGTTAGGVQRFQCRRCRRTFTETKGTPFYGCRTPLPTILLCLALLGERMSLAGIRRATGVKEETVLGWLRRAAAHVEQTEALLLSQHPLTRVQLDALWCYVGHKGEKGGT